MIPITTLQAKLDKAQYNIGAVDGVFGPNTATGLLAYVAQRPMAPLAALGVAVSEQLPNSGIMDTSSRFANFLGQACFESGYFRYLAELWGPTDAQRGYEGRKDLGNNQPGDGFKFRGRGIFQITGRAGYSSAAKALNLPLLYAPELLEQPTHAVQSAIYFWNSHGLNALADAGEDNEITRRINGGENGAAQRAALVARARGILG